MVLIELFTEVYYEKVVCTKASRENQEENLLFLFYFFAEINFMYFNLNVWFMTVFSHFIQTSFIFSAPLCF